MRIPWDMGVPVGCRRMARQRILPGLVFTILLCLLPSIARSNPGVQILVTPETSVLPQHSQLSARLLLHDDGTTVSPSPFEPLPTETKPFYLSLWFQFLLPLVLIAIISLFIRNRERRERVRQLQLEQLVAERTSELELAMQQLEQAKEAELEAQRLQTLNQLAATIAHEFNNPLGIIQGFCDLTQIDRSTDQKLKERMERMSFQVQRMHSLVRKLLRLKTLREMDYAAGLKILDIHGGGNQPGGLAEEGEGSVNLRRDDPPE